MQSADSGLAAKLRRITWTKLLRRAKRLVSREAEERIFRISAAEGKEFDLIPEFRMDCRDDMAKYVTQPGESRDTVLADWSKRLDRGEHVLTRMEEGLLVTYGWIVERQKSCFLNDVDQSYEFPDGTAVIYDFFTVPEFRNREFYFQLLIHSVRTAAEFPGTEWIYLAALADDPVPLWSVERLGTEHCESLFYRRVLWFRKKWRTRP